MLNKENQLLKIMELIEDLGVVKYRNQPILN